MTLVITHDLGALRPASRSRCSARIRLASASSISEKGITSSPSSSAVAVPLEILSRHHPYPAIPAHEKAHHLFATVIVDDAGFEKPTRTA